MGIKQFKVTDDFLSLGMDIKNCGMDSSLEDCITAKYLGKILDFTFYVFYENFILSKCWLRHMAFNV